MICCAWVALLAAGCLGSAHPDDGAVSGDDMALGGADDLADVAPADLSPPPPPDLARGYSTDPATFFGDSRCASLHAQLCEDFEAGNPGDKPSSTLWTTSGDATLDTAQLARGKQALHLHIVGQAWATIAETQTFPEPNNHFFGRLFFRASAIPTTAPNTAAPYILPPFTNN